ncbi:MAG TPA: glycosyl hydrolase family 18 protein [Streptosporangiaceae bacterium]
MRLRRPRIRAAVLAVAAATALAVPAWSAATASAAPASHPAGLTHARVQLPVYAPYFETYLPSSISAVARQSGAHFLTLAFIQTPKKGSCTPAWDGNAKEPLSGGHYLSEIATLRKMGGDVIPSFGGFSADQGGTEIADSCSSVSKIAAAYELLVTKYHVTRIDMDVEAKSLGRKAGINRRDEAIAMAQAWAAKHGTRLQVDFTLPVEPDGLQGPGLAVVKNAIADGVHVGVVNIMTFDYYQTHEGVVNMPAAAMSAAMNLHNQLAGLYPKLGGTQLWAMEGMTLLPGIDDRGKIETTYLKGMAEVLAFAQHEHMSLLSVWAIQRDNGGCPGKTDSNTCSGVKQGTWAFSHLLEHFNG